MIKSSIRKCEWNFNDPRMEKYHDEEWGTPVHDDQLLFEHLILDGFQAGLSWQTILKKRENFREAFDGFDVQKIARYQAEKVETLLRNTGIIRNRLKIEATCTNAKIYMAIQEEFGSFNHYIWQFTKGKTIHNEFNELRAIPARTSLSDTISKDLKSRGFKFAGSTIIYAFLQAVGIVNDHLPHCFRYRELRG